MDRSAGARPGNAAPLDPTQRAPRDGYDRFRAAVAGRAERLAGAWGREAADLLLLLPDLLHLFFALARDPRVSRVHKALVTAAAVYLVSPIDLVPEALLGPLGLVDDLAVAVLALDLLLNRVDRQVLAEHWRGNRDLLAVTQAGLALLARQLRNWGKIRGVRKIKIRPG